MSRSKRDILDTEKMLEQLASLLAANHFDPDEPMYHMPEARQDAAALRRISMTLHNWHELECGTDRGAIERDEKTGKPFLTYESEMPLGKRRCYPTPDREAGAIKRLKAIMARYPKLGYYIQGDPRGCALYILRPGDIPKGESANAYYSRGLAVFK